MKTTKRTAIVAVLVFGMILGLGGVAMATDYGVITSGGEWSDPATWTPGTGPPLATDRVFIGSNYVGGLVETVNLTDPRTINSLYMGYSTSAATGTLNINGTAGVTTLTVTSAVFNIGGTNSTVNQNSGNVDAVQIVIGLDGSPTNAAYNLAAGQTLTTSGAVYAGYQGTGTLTTAAGSTVNVGSHLYVGNGSVSGTLNAPAGSAIKVAGDLWLSSSSLSPVAGVFVRPTDSLAGVGSQMIVGGGGTAASFTQNDTTWKVGSTLYVGYQANGTYNMSSGRTLNVGSTLYLGYGTHSGTLNAPAGSTVKVGGDLWLSSSSLSPAAGVFVRPTDGLAGVGGQMILGGQGGGPASFTQNDTTWKVGSTLYVGLQANSTYNISSGQTLNVGSTLYLGYGTHSGTLNAPAGSTVKVGGDLWLSSTSFTPAAGVFVRPTDGLAGVGGQMILGGQGGGPASFTQNDTTWKVGSTLYVGLQANSTYNISSGQTLNVGSALNVGWGSVAGQVNVTGGGGAINAASMSVAANGTLAVNPNGSVLSPFNINGTVTLTSGCLFDIDFLANPGVNDYITVINKTAAGAVSGTFKYNDPFLGSMTLTEGTNFFAPAVGGNAMLQISYNDFGGLGGHTGTNDVVLQFLGLGSPYYWKVTDGDNQWTTPGNWTTDIAGTSPATSPPNAACPVHFVANGAATATTTTVEAPTSVVSLNFNSNASATQTINAGAAGALTLAAGISVDAGSGAVNINVPVTLAAAQTWTNNSSQTLTVTGDVTNGSNTLTVAGTGSTTISGNLGGGSGGVTKSGSGTLTLNGTNSYSGPTTITAGTLQVNGSVASGSAVDVPTSTTLGIGAGGSVARDVTVSGGSVNLAGTVAGKLAVSGGTVTTSAGSPTVTTADFSAGTGTVNASAAPLAITSTLKLPGGITATLSGATSFSASGANLADTSTASTLRLSGGTLTIASPMIAGAVNLSNTSGGLNIADSAHIKARAYYTPDNRAPYCVSNWSGMTGTFPDGTADGSCGNTTWLDYPNTGASWIAWDLGATYTISKIHVWNYNEVNLTNRGTRRLDLQTGDAAAFATNTGWFSELTNVDWTSIGANGTISDPTMVVGTGLVGYAGFDWILPSPITTQYIKFNILQNLGGDSVGLSEIAFYYQTGGGALDLSNTAIVVGNSSTLFLDGVSSATFGPLSFTGGYTLRLIGDSGVIEPLADGWGYGWSWDGDDILIQGIGSAIPEPAGLGLIGLALLALKRRKRTLFGGR